MTPMWNCFSGLMISGLRRQPIQLNNVIDIDIDVSVLDNSNSKKEGVG